MPPFNRDQEQKGKQLFLGMVNEAQHLTFSELLMLRSAWQGKLRWEEMPDKLRNAFTALAVSCA